MRRRFPGILFQSFLNIRRFYVLPTFRFHPNLLPKRLRSRRVVFQVYRRVFRDAVFRQELVHLCVSPELHFLQLNRIPRVHPYRADEREVHAERSVHAGTFQAYERPERHRCPLRVFRRAIHARL